MYELKTNNNTIHLKWGTWAMKRFCELENKNLMQLIEVLSGGVYDLDTIVHIVQAAAESGYKSLKKPIDFDEFDVCEWIDQVLVHFHGLKCVIHLRLNSLVAMQNKLGGQCYLLIVGIAPCSCLSCSCKRSMR